MAGERTESATPKRRSESKQKGQFAKSQDFNSAVMLSIGMILLFVYVPFIMNRFDYVTKHTLSNLHPSQINEHDVIGLLTPYFNLLIEVILPFLLILMICGVILIRVQVGHLFTLETIKPNFDKLSPMSMVKNLGNTFNFFSIKKIVELTKSFIKMLIIAGFAYATLNARKDELFHLLGVQVDVAFATITSILAEIVTNMCVIMIIMGIIDKKYQHYEFEKSIKMTKEEVKDERKNSEGDPKIKAKIKAAQYQFAQQRMMSQIPTANVVVTNPTHYAVALRYDTSKAPAPQIIAKGVDFVAFKIKEIAENNGVPVVENKPLARTLYKIVPLEGIIPAEMYVAVAELLAYVYKTNKDRRK
jgi:flagellar biosynthetic protein FlhB